MAPSLGVELSSIGLRDADEIERAIAAFARDPNGGLIVTASALAQASRAMIVTLAARHKLPAIYSLPLLRRRWRPDLLWADYLDQYRRAAAYVDRILKGEKPADLPVQAPTKFELVINLKTAKALGLDSAADAARPRRRGDRMKRREFITLIGGAAAGGRSRRARSSAQRRIGVLIAYSENDPEGRIRVKALEQALQKFGWIEGRNLRLVYRWASGDGGRFRTHAAELVRLGKDAIVAISSPAVKALQRETHTIPLVFTQVSDPVGQGIVDNMARPGGNTTGFTNFDPAISGKWLELLKESAPSVTRAAVIFNPKTAPYTALYMRAIETVAPSIAVKVTAAPVHNEAEIEAAFTRHSREKGGGLIVMTDVFNSVHRKQIIEVATRFALPAIYPYRYYAAEGGLMSYGIDQVHQYHGAAIYLNRILNGAKPGDLPVQAPTKYQLIINLKTAKALGLEVPAQLLALADEVIE